VHYCRVRHFGNWLRLSGKLPEGVIARAMVTLSIEEQALPCSGI
jgi:hypothetical protein